jgi:hypothetical protein
VIRLLGGQRGEEVVVRAVQDRTDDPRPPTPLGDRDDVAAAVSRCREARPRPSSSLSTATSALPTRTTDGIDIGSYTTGADPTQIMPMSCRNFRSRSCGWSNSTAALLRNLIMWVGLGGGGPSGRAWRRLFGKHSARGVLVTSEMLRSSAVEHRPLGRSRPRWPRRSATSANDSRPLASDL